MEDSLVYIGNKPVMSYVLPIVTLLNNNDVDNVTLKARGRAINRAVDVAEVIRNKFVPDTIVENIEISTDAMENSKGDSVNVSVIEIVLSKN